GPLAPTDRPIGDGLPSPLINDLLTARDGTIYAATPRGVALSVDGGRHWHYRRGHDWGAKLRGLEQPVEPAPYEVRGALLAEDYVTCLAEDDDGRIWVGHRQWAYEAFDQVVWGREASFDAEPGRAAPNVHPIFGRLLGDNVAAILCRPGERPLVAWYGGGLTEAISPVGVGSAGGGDLPLPPLWQGGGGAEEAMPSPARAPEEDTVRYRVPLSPPSSASSPATENGGQASLPRTAEQPDPVFLGDDWTTQGDWVGRYGREYALLCAMAAPLDHPVSIPNGAGAVGSLGPHHADGDRLRHWVHWPRTDNPKTLYNPLLGYRRQADWDDHGETYPMTHQGPGLRLEVTVPAGVHRVSLYFLNKDGHEHVNRNRDYLIEWCGADGKAAARARVHAFWGGVYKQFVCAGPARYGVRIERNDSLNTILQGLFIDRLSGPAAPAEALPGAWLGNARYGPPPSEPWASLDPATRILAYRAAIASGDHEAALARRRWAIPLWTAADRQEFVQVMARARQSLLASNKPAAP
ncbi:MAG: hypothetical protein HYU66_23365, partial [Armatimonadetes bacterium]|nr:hypothetical protein [Armatimonadota bacterium]